MKNTFLPIKEYIVVTKMIKKYQIIIVQKAITVISEDLEHGGELYNWKFTGLSRNDYWILRTIYTTNYKNNNGLKKYVDYYFLKNKKV